ncbi:BlaI/MecI/CopY family transcriptional regulator [Streptomyces sp. NPDC003077]|uniref:BlaI/MecI/CopY family transcriptional regulator n=1 Tax=Streptomyces sp. NPDC003077 TaxID=3154443 RepID=UPI00339E89B1
MLAASHEVPGAVSTAWVQERLGGARACSTVITILTRLPARGAVTREKGGRSFLWVPRADRTRAESDAAPRVALLQIVN